MWWIAIAVVAAGAALWGPIVSNVEQAGYTVVESHGAIEIRDYAPMIVAQTEVSGSRDEAINKGFRTIADYIFGNNAAQQNVAMTAPVIQQPSEKIAMTAPVIQQGEGEQWQVRFVMPAEYRMDTLPTPKNNAVEIKEIAGKRFAVIRFSGMADEEMLAEQTTTLNAFIKENGLQPLSPPAYAFFNPPWTLPPLRRNEVMVEVAGR
jgi:DNA gyrase inhibitor GyrI